MEETEDISVHDNHLLSYTVFAEERNITLYTTYPHRNPPEFTAVIFEEVLAYQFENDLFGTIISHIVQIDLHTLVKANRLRFENGWRYGWPRGWEKEKEDILVYMGHLEMRAFELLSSYGMDGWVIAKKMKKVRLKAKQPMRWGTQQH